MISKEQKQEIIAKFGGDEKNTGSTKAQIALLTPASMTCSRTSRRIRRTMQNQRLASDGRSAQTLLKYLRNTDIEAYRSLIAELGLRK
jgi:small subunit ribosomal protein S15